MTLLEAGGRWIEAPMSGEGQAADVPLDADEPLPDDERARLQERLEELIEDKQDTETRESPEDMHVGADLDVVESAGSPTIEPLPTVEEAAAAAIEPPPTATEEEAAIKAEPLEPLTVDSDFEDQYAEETAEELIMQRSAPLPPDFYLGMIGNGSELTWEGVMDLILSTIPESVEHLTAAQAMKVARRELQAADRDRDGILNRDETFKYFYGTLCIKFLSRKVVKSRSEVQTSPGQECQDLYKAYVQYCCLGGLSAEMSLSSWIRLCQDCSFLKQEADGRSILQLIYVNAKALGQGGRRGALLPKPKSSLNYVQFLEALEMVAEKESVGLAKVIEAILDQLAQDALPSCAEYAGDVVRDASFIVTPEQKRLAKKHQSVSARHKMHTDGWKPSLNLADDASPKPRQKSGKTKTRPATRKPSLPPLSNVTAKGWIKLCRACNLIVDEEAFSFSEKDAMAILEKVHPHHKVHPRGDRNSSARTAQTPLSHKQLMDCLQAVAGRHRMPVNKICERINNLGSGALAGMDLLPHDKLSSMDMSFEDLVTPAEARRKEVSAILKAEKSRESIASLTAQQLSPKNKVVNQMRASTGGKSWLTSEQPYGNNKKVLTPNEKQKLRTGSAVAFGRCMSANVSRKSREVTASRQERPGSARLASTGDIPAEDHPSPAVDSSPSANDPPAQDQHGICSIRSSTDIRMSQSISESAEPVSVEVADSAVPQEEAATAPAESSTPSAFPATGDENVQMAGIPEALTYKATAADMPSGVSKEIYEMLQAAREEARQARDRAEALEERLVGLLLQAPHSVPSATA